MTVGLGEVCEPCLHAQNHPAMTQPLRHAPCSSSFVLPMMLCPLGMCLFIKLLPDNSGTIGQTGVGLRGGCSQNIPLECLPSVKRMATGNANFKSVQQQEWQVEGSPRGAPPFATGSWCCPVSQPWGMAVVSFVLAPFIYILSFTVLLVLSCISLINITRLLTYLKISLDSSSKLPSYAFSNS